jgi:hypothetical protein
VRSQVRAEPDASVEPDEAVEPDPTERPDVSTEAGAAYIIETRPSSVSIPSWFKEDIRRDLNIDGDEDHDNTGLSGQVGSASVLLTRDRENLDTVPAVNAYQQACPGAQRCECCDFSTIHSTLSLRFTAL